MQMLTEDIYLFFGHPIIVRSNSKEVLAHLRLVYSRFYRGSDSDHSYGENLLNTSGTSLEIIDDIAGNNEIVIKDRLRTYRFACSDIHSHEQETFDPLGAIQWFMLWTASNLAKDYSFIHAGAVASKKGGIIFPAVSGFGKTTLAIRLVQKGYRFLSDEVACINVVQNRIEPFPRKINLTDESRILLRLPPWDDPIDRLKRPGVRKGMLDIEEIVADSLSEPCTPGYIFFLMGFGEKPRLERIAPSHALFHIFRFSISSVDNPGSYLFSHAPLFNTVQCFNLVIGDLDETADLIMHMTDQGKLCNG
ncbi:MAG: hypothetical protein AB1442_08170 [Nitrospirota bacterium]